MNDISLMATRLKNTLYTHGVGRGWGNVVTPVGVRLSLVIIGVVFLILVAVAQLFAAGPASHSIRLHDEAAVTQTHIRLCDVAEIEGNHAQALADLVVSQFEPGLRQATVTLEGLRETLNTHGVHWGLISLRGYSACLVHRVLPDPEPISATPAWPVSNPIDEVVLTTPVTLRDRINQFIEQLAGVDRADLRITFTDRDATVLDQGVWRDRFEIEPLASAPLGRVPLVIRQYRGDRVVDTHRILADVARRTMAVVAKKTIGRGQTFAPGDVEIREVYLDDNVSQPVTELAQAIGQVAGSVVRAGAVVRADQLRSPVMVRRGQLITVRCLSGGLVLKTVGRASEDGQLDQLIGVRNDRTRQSFTVRVTGLQEGIVLLDGDIQNDAPRAAPGADRSTLP